MCCQRSPAPAGPAPAPLAAPPALATRAAVPLAAWCKEGRAGPCVASAGPDAGAQRAAIVASEGSAWLVGVLDGVLLLAIAAASAGCAGKVVKAEPSARARGTHTQDVRCVAGLVRWHTCAWVLLGCHSSDECTLTGRGVCRRVRATGATPVYRRWPTRRVLQASRTHHGALLLPRCAFQEAHLSQLFLACYPLSWSPAEEVAKAGVGAGAHRS